MPRLTSSAGAGLAALLFALAACGRAPIAPAPGNDDDPQPVQNVSGTPPTLPAPAQGPAQTAAEPAPDEGGGPRDRFVVCPGNPRCPPEGQPKGGRGN